MVSRDVRLALAVAASLGVVANAQQGFMPAAFQSGAIPQLSVLSVEVGGGEVMLELTVAADGSVIDSRPLRATPSFTERIQSTSGGWRFVPAEAMIPIAEQRAGGPLTRAIESKVLVAGIFRPPTFFTPTIGEPITEVANASDEIPFPISIVRPLFPPNALNAGVVLVEARVSPSGAVIGAVVKISGPGFDDIALDAAKQWRFRPARVGGTFVPSLAYIVFGFPMPVTGGRGPVPGHE
jgi:TonB family protein